MLEEKKKFIVIGAIILILVVGGILYYTLQNNDEEYINFEEDEQNEIENIVEDEIKEEKEIVVHISGQVANSGVITLKEGSRIVDAIEKAGGLTSEADISKVNLAYVLADAQKIYIPSINDSKEVSVLQENDTSQIVTEGSSQGSTQKEENIMININTATAEELQKLNGIGSGIAEKIVAYRKENGKFNTIEDIKNVSGIGNSKFEKIKNNICVK